MTDDQMLAYDRSWRCLDNDGHPHKAMWAKQKAAEATDSDTKRHYVGLAQISVLDAICEQHQRAVGER